MRFQRFPIALRVVLAVAVPVIALLVAASSIVDTSRAAQQRADSEAERVQVLGVLSSVQGQNFLPELGAATSNGLAEAGNSGFILNIGWEMFLERFEIADQRRVELASALIAPIEVESFDRQRQSINAANRELALSGTITDQTLDEMIEARLSADQAFHAIAQRSDNYGWVVHSASADIVRSGLIEGSAIMSILVGSQEYSSRDLVALTAARESAVERSRYLADPATVADVEAMLNSDQYIAWLATVNRAHSVARGDAEPGSILAVGADLSQLLVLLDSMQAVIDRAVERTTLQIQTLADASSADQQRVVTVLAVLLILTGLIAWRILRSITVPLKRLTARAASVAEGDVGQERLQLDTSPELGRLNNTMEDLVDGLRHLDHQVRSIATGDLQDSSLDQAAPGAVGRFIQDQIEALRTASNNLRVDAVRDDLTGLLNRRGLLELVQNRETNGSLLYLDLDGFKQVNDVYGHEHGDVALIAVAQRLVDSLRSEDLVARLGGDEFVILTAGVDLDIEATVSRIQDAVRRPIVYDEVSHVIGCSIGTTDFDPVEGIEPALRRADLEMLRRKAIGRPSRHQLNPASR